MNNTLLIIDDEKDILRMLGRILELEGYQILKAENARNGKRLFESHEVHAVLTDVKLPDGYGVDLVAEFKKMKPEVEIICLTAYGSIADGVQAIKNGAFDYLVKGDDQQKIIPLVSKAVEKTRLQVRLSRLQSRLQQQFGFDHIIGHSAPLLEAITLAKKVAVVDTTVLLGGPTGTGKEVFAKAIHAGGSRSAENFIAINCSALGKELVESELFGHKAEAFTGASKEKSGLFQEAHKGTIFLDEIGEMSPDLQAKILRVLENGTFIKLGDTRETKVDVRIIAATNRNLQQEVEKGNFREDLYYRLSVFSILLPTLNERRADIPILATFFAEQFAAKCGKKIPHLSKSYLDALQDHHWKGNIRELRNVLERSVILSESNELDTDLLPFDFLAQPKPGVQSGLFRLEAVESEHIKNVLHFTGGNKTKAAELLDISLTTLYNKIRTANLES